MIEGKKISQLKETTTLNDACCFPVLSRGSTQRITFAELLNIIINNLPESGGGVPEEEIEKIRQQLNEHQTEIENLIEQGESIESALSQITFKVNGQDRTILEYTSIVQELQRAFEDIKNVIPTEASSSNKLTSKSYVDNLVETVASDVTELQSDVTELQSDVTELQSSVETVQASVSDIQALIPTQASEENQLADKNFVNSSIGTNTAHYISNNGEPFTSLAQLEAYAGTVTPNDYAFITGVEEGIAYYDRYKADVNGDVVTWSKEYRLNNSSFTAAQWAAINSGITSEKVVEIQSDITELQSDVDTAQTDISDIQDLIPSQATEENKLADRNFVNSKISKKDVGSQEIETTFTTLPLVLKNADDCAQVGIGLKNKDVTSFFGVNTSTREPIFKANLVMNNAKTLAFKDDVENTIQNLNDIKEVIDFDGKTIQFFGDSITYGVGVDSDDDFNFTNNRWTTKFCSLMNAIESNHGISASLFTSGYNEVQTITNTIKNTALNGDILIINGGINDWQLGVSISEFKTTVDNLFKYISNNYNGKVIIISPYNVIKNLVGTPINSVESYRQILCRFAKKYNFNYINGGKVSLGETRKAGKKIYYQYSDGLHPSGFGHFLIASELFFMFTNQTWENHAKPTNSLLYPPTQTQIYFTGKYLHGLDCPIFAVSYSQLSLGNGTNTNKIIDSTMTNTKLILQSVDGCVMYNNNYSSPINASRQDGFCNFYFWVTNAGLSLYYTFDQDVENGNIIMEFIRFEDMNGIHEF